MERPEVPLIQALQAHQRKGYQPFHMPGHKQGKGQSSWFKELFGSAFFAYDLTELPGLDDLHQPTSAILAAQKAAAACFGAEDSFFLVNGSTVGIQGLLLTALKPGDEILLPRQNHRSVFAGLVLTGARPRYLSEAIDADWQIPLGTQLKEVEQALVDYPKIKAFCLQHPNYYGITSNLSSLVQSMQENNQITLADEAHGPHFRFHPELPISALEAGVDGTVQSLHKVLSALTQSALVHRQGSRLPLDNLRRSLTLLQTTSPSYLLLASLDAARWQVESQGQDLWDRVLELAKYARREINCVPGLQCLGEEICRQPSVGSWDPTKLVVSVRGLGLSGFLAAEKLQQDYRILVEMADSQNVVLLITLGDDQAGVQKMVAGFKDLADKWGKSGQTPKIPEDLLRAHVSSPDQILTPREAFFWPQTRLVDRQEAVGQICGEMVCPYPPGIPLLLPGERVHPEHLEQIAELIRLGAAWQGPRDPALRKLQILEV